jgi:quinol-cytochrome oxidoreductase complex cytochrome b subunit
VLIWLVCLMLLGALAVFLPYGPHIPGVEWELGKKANPLAPAYPGIKPEWYFLWVYQLLKEFPPHIFGVEGPQGAIAVVSVLMGVWALVPWLDRRAKRGEPSPAFTDLGVAAVLFLMFLTLKAWDIGGAQSARVCAIWVLGIGIAANALRYLRMKQRWFIFSGAALLHAALHGFAGMSYLTAGAVAAIAAAGGVALSFRRRPEPAPGGPQ